ncbi:MAG: hypothetical protein R3F07_08450 [Opitutaceae bacterium]
MVRKRKGPETFSSFIAGAFGILLGGAFGVLIAAVYLVFKPVEEVKRLPEEDEMKPVVYYIEGRRSGMDGAAWVGKRNQLVSESPVELTLNEQELNQWSSASFGKRRMELMVEYGDAKIEPGIPLFRIADDRVQIGMPVEIKGIGENRRIILQAAGQFAPDGESSMKFAPETVYIGSCRIPNFQGFSSVVFGGFVSLMGSPDDVKTAWPTLSEARVEGDLIHLQRL